MNLVLTELQQRSTKLDLLLSKAETRITHLTQNYTLTSHQYGMARSHKTANKVTNKDSTISHLDYQELRDKVNQRIYGPADSDYNSASHIENMNSKLLLSSMQFYPENGMESENGKGNVIMPQNLQNSPMTIVSPSQFSAPKYHPNGVDNLSFLSSKYFTGNDFHKNDRSPNSFWQKKSPDTKLDFPEIQKNIDFLPGLLVSNSPMLSKIQNSNAEMNMQSLDLQIENPNNGSTSNMKKLKISPKERKSSPQKVMMFDKGLKTQGSAASAHAPSRKENFDYKRVEHPVGFQKKMKGQKLKLSSSLRNLRIKSLNREKITPKSVDLTKSSQGNRSRKSKLVIDNSRKSTKNSQKLSSRDTSREKKNISDFEIKLDKSGAGLKLNRLAIKGSRKLRKKQIRLGHLLNSRTENSGEESRYTLVENLKPLLGSKNKLSAEKSKNTRSNQLHNIIYNKQIANQNRKLGLPPKTPNIVSKKAKNTNKKKQIELNNPKSQIEKLKLQKAQLQEEIKQIDLERSMELQKSSRLLSQTSSMRNTPSNKNSPQITFPDIPENLPKASFEDASSPYQEKNKILIGEATDMLEETDTERLINFEFDSESESKKNLELENNGRTGLEDQKDTILQEEQILDSAGNKVKYYARESDFLFKINEEKRQ